MKPSNETTGSRIGLTLQAKLTLAFLLVGLVGFVVAFQMLPRLVLSAWNQEFEAVKDPNAERIRKFYADFFPGQGPVVPTRELANRLTTLSDFDLTGVELPERGMRLEEFLEILNDQRQLAPESDVLRILKLISGRYRIVRILPFPVPPIGDRLQAFVDPGGALEYLPLLFPIQAPGNGFVGTLVLADFTEGPGLFNPYAVSDHLVGIPLGLAVNEDVAYIPIEDIREEHTLLYENLMKESDRDSSIFEGDRRDSVYQFLPLFKLQLDAREDPEILGYFWITYKRPVGVFAWTELLSGEGYAAIASSALVALIISFIFAKRITRPVQVLTESASAFAEGRLDEPVVVNSRDEIGILATTFNEMRQRLQTTLKQLQERAETIELQKEELDEQFKALQILQNYTENVLASVDSAIFSVDNEGEVRSHNRAAQQLLRIHEGSQIDDDLSEALAERLRTALDLGETTLSEEMTMEATTGGAVPVAVSVAPLREGERVVGAVAVLTDLSVIKNLEATVSRQERLAALGQLTAGVAHEIRNPLSIIKACAEILQQNFQGQDGESGLCQDIIEESDRLSRVVSEFLTFARPSEPNRTPMNLNELLSQTLDRFELTLPEGIGIEREFDPDLPEVEADADQLEQVLLNLVRNGVEAMEGKGVVVVRSGSTGGERAVWVEVEDEGEGMEEETRRRVFDPFYTSKAQGTGLGLSICHRILESHGGSIQIRDTKPGVGTVFRMTLPAGDREPVS